MGRGTIRLIAVVGVAIVFCAAAVALAAGRSIFVEVANVKISFAATIKPQRLPKTKPVAVAVSLSSRFVATDGGHIPPMTSATVGIDRSVTIDSRGVPTCASGQLENQTTEGAEAACAAAIVGSGTARVEIAFPNAAPVDAESRLIAFNGGSAGRTTTLFLHAYLGSPVSQSIVVPVTLTKLKKGIYGMRAKLAIPKIAGGAGSVAGFDLAFKKLVAGAGGTQHGYLNARCSDGNFVFEPEVVLEGGDLARGTLAFGCTPKG
jgi:hypothetical protein